MSLPSVSVVIPVRNSSALLADCLRGLAASNLPPAEVIVVDDASTDASRAVAEAAGATVIALDSRGGPAVARNRGVDRATGEIILFVDADTIPHEGTTLQVAQAFADCPGLAAVMGSYDDRPTSPDFLSQYRNLLHCFTHHEGSRNASTFWCGCGAIRRQVYQQAGGLDETFKLPSIEDIDLGYRLKKAGHLIWLDPKIQVTHQKRWGAWDMIRTDVVRRGIPWTRLILREGGVPNDLNLKWSQRVCVAAAGLSIALWIAVLWYPHWALVTGLTICISAIFVGSRAFLKFLAERRGIWFAAKSIPWIYGFHVYSGLSLVIGVLGHVARRCVPGTGSGNGRRPGRTHGGV